MRVGKRPDWSMGTGESTNHPMLCSWGRAFILGVAKRNWCNL
ncbi:MAG: hypothetical protein H6Q51_2480 [Deltaproteobacteria bacterium]|nr:hypothetical protein [Deltaproteobacteria bacterium]